VTAFQSNAANESTLTALVDLLADAVAERVLARLKPTPAPAQAEPWRLLNVDEVAATLGRSKRWVHSAVKERGLPIVRLDGGALAFDPDAVRAWALARQVPAVDAETLAGRWQGNGNGASDAGLRNPYLPTKQKVQGSRGGPS
jgi:hypothetical protein